MNAIEIIRYSQISSAIIVGRFIDRPTDTASVNGNDRANEADQRKLAPKHGHSGLTTQMSARHLAIYTVASIGMPSRDIDRTRSLSGRTKQGGHSKASRHTHTHIGAYLFADSTVPSDILC